MQRGLLFLTVSSLFFLAGCPNKGKVKPTSSPVSSKARLPELLRQIRDKRSSIQSLEGRAKLRVYHPNGRRSTYRLFFQLQRPNRLFFSITVAMQPVIVATSDGKNCALYQVTQKAFWHGPSARLPRVLGRFLPPQLPLEQLVPILFGELPVLPAKQVKQISKTTKLVAYRLQGDKHVQRLWIETLTRRFVKTLFETQGKPPLSLRYGTFRGTPPLPKRVIFENKKSKQRIVWIFYKYTVNPKIPIKSFQQTPPKGNVKVYRL